MNYQGSCHCEQIAFAVEGDLADVVACNCSMCERKGILMWFVPRSALVVLTPPERIRTYTFNKHVIKHHFCPECGIHPFGEANAPTGEPTAAILEAAAERLTKASHKLAEVMYQQQQAGGPSTGGPSGGGAAQPAGASDEVIDAEYVEK